MPEAIPGAAVLVSGVSGPFQGVHEQDRAHVLG